MDDLSNIYKEKLTIAYAVAFGVVAAVGFFLIFTMDLKNYNNIMNTITSVQTNSKILNEIGRYDEFVKDFSGAFTEPKSPNWLIDIITEHIKTLNIKLDTVKPLEPQMVSGFKIIRVQVDGSGDFKDIAGLISILEHQKKYLFIENMDISSAVISADVGVTDFERNKSMLPMLPNRTTKFRLIVSGVNSE